MLLSNSDIETLQNIGYMNKAFVGFDKHGYARLRNQHGWCVFYDVAKGRCRVYKNRPAGCRTYPVIWSDDDGVIIDVLCPMKSTISLAEIRKKGIKLMDLLAKIEQEAEERTSKA